MSMIAQSYPSLDAFYDAGRRRRHSRERDVGLVWRGSGGGTVSVLARRFGLGELQVALGGYRDVCGRAGSLLWFLTRVSDAATLAVTA
jgi:hypothetical protein